LFSEISPVARLSVLGDTPKKDFPRHANRAANPDGRENVALHQAVNFSAAHPQLSLDIRSTK